MTDITDADEFLEPRYGSDWADLAEEKKQANLLMARDYILSSYIFTVDDPEVGDSFKPAWFYLAFAMSSQVVSIGATSPITSHEERLEGVVTEKTTYSVSGSSDPYPYVTRLLSPIIARVGGFQIVELGK